MHILQTSFSYKQRYFPWGIFCPFLNLRIKTKCLHRISLQTNPTPTTQLPTLFKKPLNSSLYLSLHPRLHNTVTSYIGCPMDFSSSSRILNFSNRPSFPNILDILMFIVSSGRYTSNYLVEHVWISEIKEGTHQTHILASSVFGRERGIVGLGQEKNQKWWKKWQPLGKLSYPL